MTIYTPQPPSPTTLDMILYPPLAPYMTGMLKVDDHHHIYFEQSGNPHGVPVIVCHGGPGAGSNPAQRQFFDPAHYRIILFDQRGCGKSLPFGSTHNNTTKHLVADMEKIREQLELKKFHLFGGSWGSTLALCYAIAHPQNVLSMTLRGIFMMRQSELDWFTNNVKNFFPENHESLLSFLKPHERAAPFESYYQYLTADDPALCAKAAAKWSHFEASISRLIPKEYEHTSHDDDPSFDLAISRLETHYFMHCRFSPDDYILQNCDRIKDIPTAIIQGRYDMVCPPISAYELAQKLNKADLMMIADAGHSSSELGTAKALVKATARFKAISAF
jgi:proline iminopeptidase